MTGDPGERKSPRAMLAAIALAKLPVPAEIGFDSHGADTLKLRFSTLADARPWVDFLCLAWDDYLHTDGRRYLRIVAGRWLGWTVSIWASEKVESDELRGDVKAALAQIVTPAADPPFPHLQPPE